MFRPEPFNGTEDQVIGTAHQFWSEYALLLEKTSVSNEISAFAGKVAKLRKVKFFDTPDCLFHQHYFNVRERFNLLKKKNKLSLKFRHPDHYLAWDHPIKAPFKFEEDIKPTFQVLYSTSKKETIPASASYEQVTDLKAVFPEIAFSGDLPVTAVGGFTALEKVIDDGTFVIDPDIPPATCDLIIWYDHQGNQEAPLLVEFSFRYKCKSEKHTVDIARKAFTAFQLLPTMKDWYNPHQVTKTNYVFGLALDEKSNRLY